MSKSQRLRVVGIQPSTRGFGFAVLEGPERLVDWGLREVAKPKHARCLREIGAMVARFRPDAVVFEDERARGCRRCSRVRALLHDVRSLAKRRKLKAPRVSRAVVRSVFAPGGKITKHGIAIEVANRFPQLLRHLPAARKPWMSEDQRMSIFDAVAFALVFFNRRQDNETSC